MRSPLTTARCRLLATVVAAGLAATGLAACGSSSTAADAGVKPGSVTIGLTLPLTGTGARYGEDMRDGFLAGVKDINANGGADGTQIKTVVLDSQAQASPAVSAMRQAVTSDGAVAIVTAFTAPPLAELPQAERYKVPLLNGGGNDPSLGGHDWLFNDVLSVADEFRAALTWAKENKGVKSVGIIQTTANTDEGKADIANVAKEVLGADPVQVTIDDAATDVTGPVDTVLNAKPDAIFINVAGTAQDLVFKMLQARGVNATLLMGSQIFAGPAPTGDVATHMVAARQEYKPSAAFSQAMGGNPTLYAGTYYSLAQIVSAAISKLNEEGKPVTGDALRQEFDGMDGIDGCCGPTGFNSNHGSTSKAEIVTFDASGKPTTVDTVANN
jgi:ABC-type branched-subunit amino acid transport system substrate-binding protein